MKDEDTALRASTRPAGEGPVSSPESAQTSLLSPRDSEESLSKLPDRTVTIPGITLGPYLGEGAMAIVFQGFDNGFRPPRPVAIKLMDSTLSACADYRSRFEREAALVGSFRHDNIVRVFASGETGGLKYIVMEYLTGGTLSRKLESGPLDAPAALQIAARMADALAYSHQRGVIHRDFKPANILLTDEGKPVLSDFGVAKDLSTERTELTQGMVAIGAPKYMSPEQLLAQPVTDRADIYSWGLTLFQMLTGELPSPQMRMQREPADSSGLTAALPGISRPVVDLICQCLQENSFLRPAAPECYEVLIAELARISGSARTSASDATVARRPDGTASSAAHTPYVVVGAVGLTLIVLISGALYFGLQPSDRQPASQSRPTAPSTTSANADPSAATIKSTATPTASDSPRGDLCGLPISAQSVDTLVSQGLKAQVHLSFAGDDTEQASAVDEVRRAVTCLRELRKRGYETQQSQQWISDAETSLTRTASRQKQ